jgi:hypothetical protein
MNDIRIAEPAVPFLPEPAVPFLPEPAAAALVPLITPLATATYEEALHHMRKHLGRLALRFRVDVADIRQTLFLVWQRVARHARPLHAESRDAFYKYLYRALENELTDTVGVHPENRQGRGGEVGADASREQESAGVADGRDDDGTPRVPAVDDQIRNLFVRACTEAAFPEAVRTHPLYGHPSCRTVLEGILNQEPVDQIARRLGVTRRRINAQIETIERVLAEPDAAQVDRIFRALPEQQWLPGAPLARRSIESLRYNPRERRLGGRILKTLRRFMCLGTQPAVVHVDQFGRVLSGFDVCVAARILGVSSVATLLQVLRSSSPDLDDEAYRRACEETDHDEEPALDLIPAFQRLVEEGSVSGLVAAFLHQLGKAAQYTILRELGTSLVPLLGVREARNLLRAAREGTMQVEVSTQRERMVARVLEHRQAAAA